MVEAVHDADLLPDVLLLLGRVGLEEFPCPDFSSFLFHKSEDLSKLPTVNEREEESQVELSSLLSRGWQTVARGGRSGLPLFIVESYWNSATHLFIYILSTAT